jgi:5-(carboxyamino)imidazole ribonucleotide mutase
VKRTPGEWAGLAVAFLFAGAVVTFGILIVGSLVDLPPALLGIAAVLGLAAIAYPILRTTPACLDDAWGETAMPAAAAAVRGGTIERTDMSGPVLVAIIMGSESDRAVMAESEKMLTQLGVPFETIVASAHRQPEKVHEWASGLAGRGVKVVIAAAGKAAHLGGVVAAYTPLPVIAVPMKTSDLGGLDSLLSMVQMPSGVPVACVAIDGAKNAAVLATQILGTSTPQYRAAIEEFKRTMAEG